MKTFDEAGRELAESFRQKAYDADPQTSGFAAADFLAGRDSCKEALRVACRNLEYYAAKFSDAQPAIEAVALLRAFDCYVEEDCSATSVES